MKFDIEIVYTQEIIMSYITFEKFSKKGFQGVKHASPSTPLPLRSPAFLSIFFFLRLYEEITEYLMIKYYVISIEKAIDAIFILIKVHLSI